MTAETKTRPKAGFNHLAPRYVTTTDVSLYQLDFHGLSTTDVSLYQLDFNGLSTTEDDPDNH